MRTSKPTYSAIRSGHCQLIDFHHDERVELYHLRDDISESQDLAASQHELVQRLRERLHT